MQAAPHPIDELRAARRDLLAALQGCTASDLLRPGVEGCTASDLLRPGVEGDRCGRGVLLHIAAWLWSRRAAALIVFFALQRYFVTGLTAGAIKG